MQQFAAVRTREIYRSPNGDRWLLARDADIGRVFVRHEPNLPSGGQPAAIEIGAFLIAAASRPENQKLLPLIGGLVEGVPPSTHHVLWPRFGMIAGSSIYFQTFADLLG